MRALQLPTGRLSVVCLAAHPDDLEIGCGATLLALAEHGDVSVHTVLLSGTPDRVKEAEEAQRLFLGRAEHSLEVHGFQDGSLPGDWSGVKAALQRAAAERPAPDLVLAPRLEDRHQDHRLVAELAITAWRDSLVLRYEIPKWDGDLGAATHYVPLSEERARRKVELLDRSYPSQSGRDWWGEDLFLGLMRVRGVECRAPYAEAFVVDKAVLSFAADGP